MQFERLRLPRPESALPPPFTQEPWTGGLPHGPGRVLYTALARRTTTPDTCWLGIWEGWGGLHPGSIASGGLDGEGDEFNEGQEELHRLNSALADLQRRVATAPRFDHPGRKYLLAEAPCRSVTELDRPPLGLALSLVWPEDRAWCVGSEIDFDSTLVAASEECIAGLLSEDGLEFVRVGPDDRLDIDGDELNLP